MTALFDQELQIYNKLSVALSDKEIQHFLPQVNHWKIENQNDIKQINKVFKFKDFSSAVSFANRIAELAEFADHHPRICIEWGKTTINWWTHRVSGLFINDFIMAARCDRIYQDELSK